MEIVKTKIQGVFVLNSERFCDDRGFFSESWNKKTFENIGIKDAFVQDNHSFSIKAGTLRGLHFQYPPLAQAKLVRCGRGEFLDVVVDIRNGSPTYGQWVGEKLSFENGRQLFVPEGFLHGFITTVCDTEIIYKCSNFYNPAAEGIVAFNDPDLNIDWKTPQKSLHVSLKDRVSVYLRDIKNPFKYEG